MSDQIAEAVLTIDQRRKRSIAMRKNKEKLKRARERARSKRAPEKNIKMRAEKLARQMVRKRVAGDRGQNYGELSVSEKIQIDKLLDSPEKIKLIRKLADRLLPKVRRMEQDRLQSFMKGHQLKNLGQPEGHHTMNEELNQLFREYFGSTGVGGRQSMGGPAQNSNKMIGKDKKKVNQDPIKQYLPFNDKKEAKIKEALERKSEKSGVDVDILSEVFVRGLEAYPENCKVTLEQYAFARVNSFINLGKTYYNEDADLQEACADKKEVQTLSDKIKKLKAAHKNPDAHEKALKEGKDPIHDEPYDYGLKHTHAVSWKTKTGYAAQLHINGKPRHVREAPDTIQLAKKLRAIVPHLDHVRTEHGKVYDSGALSFPEALEASAHHSSLKEDTNYEEMLKAKSKKDKEAREKYPHYYQTPKGSGHVTGHDWDNPEHVTILVNRSTGVRSKNNDEHEEISVHPKDLKVNRNQKWTSVQEGKMKELSVDLQDMDNGNFKKKYGKSKDQMTSSLGKPQKPPVAEIVEVEIIGKGSIRFTEEREVEIIGGGPSKNLKKAILLGPADKKDHVVIRSKNWLGKPTKLVIHKSWIKEDLEEAKKMKGKDPCWKNYTMVGTKKKNGKEVPNCVPESLGPEETGGSKTRKQIQTVPRQDNNRKESGISTRHQEVLKKVIHEKLGNKTSDSRKRLTATDSLVATYKADTPFAEEAQSSDRKPVVIPSFTRRNPDGSTVTIPAKTVLRKSNRQIVGSGNSHDGKPD